MSRRRALAFRITAMLLGFAPLLLLEVTLRLTSWGDPDPRIDPWVSFSAVQPLFERDESTGHYEIAASRQGYFRPDSFRIQKGASEYRVFVLGGSTVQGNPWGIETSFTRWLEISLQAANPSRDWRIVNCGGISYASYRLVPILDEVLRYEPDLIIVYSGHNEFLEDREYASVKHQSGAVTWLIAQAARTRSFHALRQLVCGPVNSTPTSPPTESSASIAARPQLPQEVAARLDFQGGLAKYHRDDAWRDEVEQHYESNLRRMVTLCRAASVPLILMNPVCNLRDSPPFKSEHRASLSPEDQAKWDELWADARMHYATDMPQAVYALRQALTIDDQHAGLHYELAKCLDAQGQVDDSRTHYHLARDLDVCPLRIRDSMNQAVLRVARETNTPCVDACAVFAHASRDGIPGGFLLVDHVHPSIKGHQLLADALFDQFVQRGITTRSADWEGIRDQAFQQHLDSLDSFYFLAGQRHLHALRNWAAGKATRLPGSPSNRLADQPSAAGDSPATDAESGDEVIRD